MWEYRLGPRWGCLNAGTEASWMLAGRQLRAGGGRALWRRVLQAFEWPCCRGWSYYTRNTLRDVGNIMLKNSCQIANLSDLICMIESETPHPLIGYSSWLKYHVHISALIQATPVPTKLVLQYLAHVADALQLGWCVNCVIQVTCWLNPPITHHLSSAVYILQGSTLRVVRSSNPN